MSRAYGVPMIVTVPTDLLSQVDNLAESLGVTRTKAVKAILTEFVGVPDVQETLRKLMEKMDAATTEAKTTVPTVEGAATPSA